MKQIHLYDYQSQMLQNIKEELAKASRKKVKMQDGTTKRLGRSVMVQMPTGTGKTYVMAAAIRNAKVDGETWVVAHRRELVEQMERTLDKFGLKFVNAKSTDNWPRAKIRVMSIQWLTRNIYKVPTAPGLIVIDEAHHAMAPSYQELWTAFPEALRIGFTATPCRMQRVKFTRLFDKLLQSWSIDRFIREGRLSLYDYVVINRHSDEQRTIDGFKRRGADGDYSVTEMDEKLNMMPKIARLYQSVERYAHGKKGIVYAINIDHAKNIAGFYSRNGLRAVAIDSKTPAAQRAQMVEDFRNSRICCLVNVNLFDEGFDCPDVEFIQMARPTLSLSKYMQMVGRGLRVHPDKKLCVLIDNVGLYRMFGRPNAHRDWDKMFEGKCVGRGKPDYLRMKNELIMNNDMEVVASHSSISDRTKYMEDTEPFEKDGRWGLRSGETIVLRPIYRMIEPFVGDFCAYMLAPNRWGILRRNGRSCVSPDYKKVEILADGYAILTQSEIYSEKVRLE